MIFFKDKEFEGVIKDSVLSPRTLNWEHCRAYKRHLNLAVVFLDMASLSARIDGYWNFWLVTHVFFSELGTVILAPEGWKERLQTFDHWTLGGSTTFRWR